MRTQVKCARATLLCIALPWLVHAASPSGSASGSPSDDSPTPVEAALPVSPISNDRILGVIPNFQTVSDPKTPYVPLPVRDKFWLFVKESVDPYTFGTSAAGAALSQFHNDDPKFGGGGKPYLERLGAAQADVTTQNFFSDAVLASLFREDPRYFRKGPGTPVILRITYALSRVVITRRDSGRNFVNFSGILGTGMGIFLSDVYYPRQSVGGGEIESRLLTSFSSAAMGNLLPEFWPDVKQKLDRFRRSHQHPKTLTERTN